MQRPKRNLLVVLHLASGATSGAAWLHWLHSPSYSLSRLAKAVASHDLATAHEYLDVHAAATQVVSAVTEQATAGVMQQATTSDNGFEAMGAAFGAAMIRQLTPVLVTGIAAGIDSAIAGTSTTTANPARPSESAAPGGDVRAMMSRLRSSFADNANTQARIGDSRVNGDSAEVDVHLRAEDLDTTLVLTVAQRRIGNHWRVVGLSNITQFIASREESERRRLATANATRKAASLSAT